jgi:hypothetical protein
MPLLHSIVKAVTKPMPKVLSPGAHAVADYISIAGFMLLGALAMRSNKRAGAGLIACGVAEAATVMLTDFPGGVVKKIPFSTHGKIDMGLAAVAATLPGFLGFEKDAERVYFEGQALLITAVTGMTDFGRGRDWQESFERDAA